MSDEPKRDWGKTWLHFTCGAIVGAIMGAYFWLSPSWLDSEPSWGIGVLLIAGSGLLIGFLAAFFLDDFWEKFLGWFRWW